MCRMIQPRLCCSITVIGVRPMFQLHHWARRLAPRLRRQHPRRASGTRVWVDVSVMSQLIAEGCPAVDKRSDREDRIKYRLRRQHTLDNKGNSRRPKVRSRNNLWGVIIEMIYDCYMYRPPSCIFKGSSRSGHGPSSIRSRSVEPRAAKA